MKMTNDRINIFNEAVRSTVIYLTKKKLDGFYFSVISWVLTIRHIIARYLLLLYMCIIRTYF